MELSDADVKALRSGFRQFSVEVVDEKVAMPISWMKTCRNSRVTENSEVECDS